MLLQNKPAKLHKYAAMFSALSDETRLSLVADLASGNPLSITQLADGSKLTRQAVTKHLQVLEKAGIVYSNPTGREKHFKLSEQPFKDIEDYLSFVSEQWDNALLRLKSFVEE